MEKEVRKQLKSKGGLGVQGSRRGKEAGEGGRGMSDVAGTRDCFALPSQMCSGSQSLVTGQQGPHPVSSLDRKLG